MAIEKPLGKEELSLEAAKPVDIELVSDDNSNVQMMDDGSAVIGDVPEQPQVEFGSNLAEYLDEDDLMNSRSSHTISSSSL